MPVKLSGPFPTDGCPEGGSEDPTPHDAPRHKCRSSGQGPARPPGTATVHPDKGKASSPNLRPRRVVAELRDLSADVCSTWSGTVGASTTPRATAACESHSRSTQGVRNRTQATEATVSGHVRPGRTPSSQPSDPRPRRRQAPALTRHDTTWPDILGHILGHLRPPSTSTIRTRVSPRQRFRSSGARRLSQHRARPKGFEPLTF